MLGFVQEVVIGRCRSHRRIGGYDGVSGVVLVSVGGGGWLCSGWRV